MEALHKLESVDNGESRSSVSRLQRRLAAGRDPGLLADLVDGYFAKGSKRVLKILTSLKDVQSQVGSRCDPDCTVPVSIEQEDKSFYCLK